MSWIPVTLASAALLALTIILLRGCRGWWER